MTTPSADPDIPANTKRIAVLGSTGSIGTSALEVIAASEGRLRATALSAHRRLDLLVTQAHQYRPKWVIATDEAAADRFRWNGLPRGTELVVGQRGLEEVAAADDVDLVLAGIVGSAGLRSTWAALEAKKTVALANKESLVMGGPLVVELAAKHGATILPVDSEHCAVFQCLRDEPVKAVRRVHLTASGGPFRQRPLDTFASITKHEALQHPTWTMGPRITIGSATMMNKAFEILEAHWLFGLPAEQIAVVVHPQSIVHSMVEFIDGSMLAQCGVPDMRVPILYCLAHPERLPFAFEPFDPVRWQRLEFEAVQHERYPAVPLAYEVLRLGGDAGAVLNAADEVATAAFLQGRIPFTAITALSERVLADRPTRPIGSLQDVFAADAEGRRAADRILETNNAWT